jgi:putative FmdB family regulatory protein
VPTYEYVCRSCGTHVEVFQHFSDAPLVECGVCGGPLRKVFHPAGILFKGSGFYATDSRKVGTGSSGDRSRKSEEHSASKGSATTGSASQESGGKQPESPSGPASKEKEKSA